MAAYREKRNRKIKIILLIVGSIIFASGVFLLGKKFSKDKKPKQNSDAPAANSKTKKELETKLSQIISQINHESNPERKKELEGKQKELEKQIQNLGGSNNPIPNQNPLPSPSQNPPSKNPPKMNRQFTVKNNGVVGGKWEYINIDNPQERILIDSENKIFYSDVAFYIKDDKFTITFCEEDAEKDGKGRFIFNEKNNKFQLTPANSSPPPPNNPSQNKIDTQVKWGGGSGEKGYWLFLSADWPKTRKRIFISQKHPLVKGKKFAHKITPNFQLTFEEKDVSKKVGDEEIFFDENNNNFTLTPLADWPDDPNYDKAIDKELPPTPKTQIKLKFVNTNFEGNFLFDNMTEPGGIEASKHRTFIISKLNPEIRRLLQENKLQSNKYFNLEYSEINGYNDNSKTYTFDASNKNLKLSEA